MIKLFITDIDGCLTTPFKKPDWKILEEIKRLNERSSREEHVPPLSICSGRPMPYVEAVAQWMGIERPVIFESAGIFNPADYQISVNGTFDDAAEQQVKELKKWLRREIIPRHDGMASEFSKFMDAGLVHPQKEVIMEVLPSIREYVAANHPEFDVHYTDVSVNIVFKGNDKAAGITSLCKLENVDLSEVAYIGDSSGDVPGLKLVGRPFAPQNAAEDVKQVASVLTHSVTAAVLEAYNLIIDANKEEVRN